MAPRVSLKAVWVEPYSKGCSSPFAASASRAAGGSMAQPPCKLVKHPKPGSASTFVVQVAWRDPEASGSANLVDDGGILWAYAFTKLMGNAGAVALVYADRPARYFALTVSNAARTSMPTSCEKRWVHYGAAQRSFRCAL